MMYEGLNFFSEVILLIVLLSILKNHKKHSALFVLLIPSLFLSFNSSILLQPKEKLGLLIIMETIYIYSYTNGQMIFSTILSLLFNLFMKFLSSFMILFLTFCFPYQFYIIYYEPIAIILFILLKVMIGYVCLEKITQQLKGTDFTHYGSLSQIGALFIYIILFIVLTNYHSINENNTFLYFLTTLMFMILSMSLYHYLHLQLVTNQYQFYKARADYLEPMMKTQSQNSTIIHDMYNLLLKNHHISDMKDYLNNYQVKQRFISIDEKLDQTINLILNDYSIQLVCDIQKETFVNQVDIYILLTEIIKAMDENTPLTIQCDDTFKVMAHISQHFAHPQIQYLIQKYNGIVSHKNNQFVLVLFDVR